MAAPAHNPLINHRLKGRHSPPHTHTQTQVTLTDVDIINGVADNGGGMYITDSPVTMTRTAFTYNNANHQVCSWVVLGGWGPASGGARLENTRTHAHAHTYSHAHTNIQTQNAQKQSDQVTGYGGAIYITQVRLANTRLANNTRPGCNAQHCCAARLPGRQQTSTHGFVRRPLAPPPPKCRAPGRGCS